MAAAKNEYSTSHLISSLVHLQAKRLYFYFGICAGVEANSVCRRNFSLFFAWNPCAFVF
jgi:hypothetical protein